MGRVLEDLQSIPAGEGVQGIHIRGLTIEVYGQESTRSRRDRRLDLAHVDVRRGQGRVDRDRGRPGEADRQPGRDVGVGRDDDLVTRPEAPGPEDQVKRVEAAADTHGVGDPAIRCEGRLEARDLLAQDEASRA